MFIGTVCRPGTADDLKSDENLFANELVR